MAGIRDYLSLIRFSHTVFALPFALISLLIATDGHPSLPLLGKVVLAVLFARSAAMSYNRYADRWIDAANPRTSGREIPRGTIGARSALLLTVACSVGFFLTALWINQLCFWLSFPVVACLLGYSHAKRFTSLAHLWLGFSLGVAPPAAWIAARGTFDASLLAPGILGLGVLVWVAGFDIIYACQDDRHDRAVGLCSIPVRLGRAGAFRVARWLHALSVLLFGIFAIVVDDMGWAYLAGVVLAAGLLVYEHCLIDPDDLSKMNTAFFTMNGLVSISLLGCTLIDLYVL